MRDFRLMWAAGGLDNAGRWMDTVVMGLLVLNLTDSAFQVALLFVFRWIPLPGAGFDPSAREWNPRNPKIDGQTWGPRPSAGPRLCVVHGAIS